MSLALLLVGALSAHEGNLGSSHFALGGYHIDVPLNLVEGEFFYGDSPEKEMLGYVNLFFNGGEVEYSDYLGERSLDVKVPLLQDGEPVDWLNARALISEFYDVGKFSPCKLTQREIIKGNELIRGLLLDSLDGKSNGVHKTKPVSFDSLNSGVQDYLVRMEEYCPECRVDVPVERRLRAVVDFAVETTEVRNGAYHLGFGDGTDAIGIVIGENLDWVKLSYNGKVFSDGGEFGHLDGYVDSIASMKNLLNSEYVEGEGYVIAEPSDANQFVYDCAVELLHGLIPEQYQVTFDGWLAEVR